MEDSTSSSSVFPKSFFREGDEPQVIQINNLLTKIKEALPLEYAEVRRDPTFAHVFAIHENGLGYSARTIQSILGRRLVTNKKHELWFVFGKKPSDFCYKNIINLLVPCGLNKSSLNCGVYALKYIECHFLNLPLNMLDDKNIKQARVRLAVDTWEAACDPKFIERMSKYKPLQLNSDVVDIE